LADFFVFPFAEEKKRQNPKTKKNRVHSQTQRFLAKIHNAIVICQVLSVVWDALHHALLSGIKPL
jgi:hypothetical protein